LNYDNYNFKSLLGKMIVFLLLISRHGKTRMNKYYRQFTHKERISIQKEVTHSY